MKGRAGLLIGIGMPLFFRMILTGLEFGHHR